MVHVEVLTHDVVVSPGIVRCFFLCLSVNGIPCRGKIKNNNGNIITNILRYAKYLRDTQKNMNNCIPFFYVFSNL